LSKHSLNYETILLVMRRGADRSLPWHLLRSHSRRPAPNYNSRYSQNMYEIIKNYIRGRKAILRSNAENKRYIVDEELPNNIASGHQLEMLKDYIKKRYEILHQYTIHKNWEKLKQDMELLQYAYLDTYDGEK